MKIKCNLNNIDLKDVQCESEYGTGLPTMAIQMLRTAFHRSFSRAIA